MDRTDWHLLECFPRRRTAAARHPRRRAARHQPAGVEPLAGAAAVRSRRAVVPPRRPFDPPDQAGRAVPGAGGARARRDRQWPPRARRFSRRPTGGDIARLPAHAWRAVHSGAGAPLQSASMPAVRFAFVQNNSTHGRSAARTRRAGPYFCGGSAGPCRLWLDPRRRISNSTLIVPRSHRLARRRQVKLRDVANERFVSFKQGHAIRRMTDDLCKAAGFLPEISFEADDFKQRSGICRGRVRGWHRPARGVRLCRCGEPQDRRAGGAAPHRSGLDGRPLPVGQRAAVS